MEIAIHEAKGKLSGLIKAAETGEHVVLTRHGRPVAEIKPLIAPKTAAEKREALMAIALRARDKQAQGADAAHAADFLYDDTGMPS
ncbi:type II toxin-antitoxin system Phd/YefM family antitoxin [Kordiimonas lipolytica]|uniref:Antitoxin n=1 Tax=Kordiimonas lipolytica TaxID=1662421 RepID=A0ABV8UBS3_9PROT|nr:type II toxin-antitoxin system prevent-host-death family antitoxin [Kordiimonas lipolytica]